MCKLILSIFFINFAMAQDSQMGIEVVLIDNSFLNDPGLVNILETYNVVELEPKYWYPIAGTQDRIYQTVGGDNLPTLLADLTNYPVAVESAVIAKTDSFYGYCYSQILNSGIGIPVGFSNGNVTTNDSGLNQIFQNFNVYFYEQAFPLATSDVNLRVYQVLCDCNVDDLMDALASYSTVIESVELVPRTYPLSTDNDISIMTSIFPNPFTDGFEIKSNSTIANYQLADMTGKQIISTGNFTELQVHVKNIQSGTYLLKVESDTGLFNTTKIIKQ